MKASRSERPVLQASGIPAYAARLLASTTTKVVPGIGGFFSASTVEHEATRRRPADKTALQGLITVELNWRADHPSWRGPVTPGPASRRGDALAINGFPCVRHKFLRTVDPGNWLIGGLPFLGSRGVWLTKRAPDKPAVTSPSGIPTCPLY